jgi:hypothetical protein
MSVKTFLSDYNTTFTYRQPMSEILQLLNVDDYLCILNTNRFEPLEGGHTQLTSEWFLYPITDKTRSSLMTNNIRWNNQSYHFLQSSDGKHTSSCYMLAHHFQAYQDDQAGKYTLVQERNRIVLTEVNIW